MGKPILLVFAKVSPIERLRLSLLWQELRLWLELSSNRRMEWGSVRFFRPRPFRDVWAWANAHVKTLYPNNPIVVLVEGAGGFAGANPDTGVALLGDACLDEVLRRKNSRCRQLVPSPELYCYRNAQAGALLHELLHLSRFAHEDGGIMAEPWEYPHTILPGIPVWAHEVLSPWGRRWRTWLWKWLQPCRCR